MRAFGNSGSFGRDTLSKYRSIGSKSRAHLPPELSRPLPRVNPPCSGGFLPPEPERWSFHGDSDPSEHNQQRRPTSEMAESGRISTVFLVSPRERRRVWGRRECKPTGAPVSGRVGEPSSRTVEIASAEFVGAGLRRPLLRAPVSSSQCSSKKTTGAGNE